MVDCPAQMVLTPETVIVGKASMNGAERYNLALARRRAEALRNYVSAHYPYYPGVLSIQVVGEPWAELRSASVL